jgi:transposase
MSENELRQLTADEIVAYVRRLEGDLAAAQAQLAKLEAELAARGGPPKTPTNSSVPPAKGWKRNRPPTGGKRGPPAGHVGRSRPRQAPDAVVACYPTHCVGCGAALAAADAAPRGTSQVVDLPPVQAVVVEARRYAIRCRACGTITRAEYPAGLEPTRVFGPGVEALLSYLHERHHVSYERLQELCVDWFRLELSEGAIANCLQRVAGRLTPQAAAIKEQVRASPTVGADETSARVNGRTHWQWVFQTPEASYHQIVPRRNGAVVEAFQAGTVAGTWVSDLWKPQLNAAAERHQICLAHQLRDLQYAIDREQSAWAQDCQTLFRLAIHRAHQRDAGELWGAAYTAVVRRIEADCDRLLATPVPGAEASRLWVRFREHREHLFVFLDDPGVPPTNNGSEQALRPSVVHRNVTGGFRSEWGAAAHATYATVLDTARKRGQTALATLQAILGPPVTLLPQLEGSPTR